MPDFLTRRNGTWHFVRRVPVEFASLDPRGIIKHSTKVRVSSDRAGRKATLVADELNQELENYWQELFARQMGIVPSSYDQARQRARSLGFDYIEVEQLAALSAEKRFERLRALSQNGLVGDAGARAALLGAEKRPPFLLSKLFVEYEAATQDEIKGFSPSQLRVWRNGRTRAVKQLVKVVGDKPITELTLDHGLDYCDWWRGS